MKSKCIENPDHEHNTLNNFHHIPSSSVYPKPKTLKPKPHTLNLQKPLITRVDGQPRKSHSNPSSSVAAAAANVGSTLTGLFGGGWPQPKGADGPGPGPGQAGPGAAHQSPSKMAIEVG